MDVTDSVVNIGFLRPSALFHSVCRCNTLGALTKLQNCLLKDEIETLHTAVPQTTGILFHPFKPLPLCRPVS